MKAQDAIYNIVKPDLEALFGEGLASLIIMSARTKSGAPSLNLKKDDYNKLVKAICEDKRVIDMCGESGAKDRLFKWQSTEID